MPGDGSPLSDEGDLSHLAEDIKNVFKKHGFEDPAFGVAFTLPEDRKKVSWVTGVPPARASSFSRARQS